MCGENLTEQTASAQGQGSSPRVRGKRLAEGEVAGAEGLIPACAGKTGRPSSTTSAPWAHPRVCGENSPAYSPTAGLVGSSPRVRGKRADRCAGQPRKRLIPACAGKTRRRRGGGPGRTAHPHVCGENDPIVLPERLLQGSSPRVRGKHWDWAVPGAGCGLIPACAGKTASDRLDHQERSAHPRVCGENDLAGADSQAEWGSSPRVRGKRRPHPRLRSPVGLIPACAGKTLSTHFWRARPTAHPRVCGENGALDQQVDQVVGSSPRVRGKPHPRRALRNPGRLIPACAGKTAPPRSTPSRRTAHPRVCGENAGVTMHSLRHRGSSPRVRGKHPPVLEVGGPVGLIPACAGKTWDWRTASTRAPAHPRVCGENRIPPRAATTGAGSSPRVRGKRARHSSHAAAPRLIPACAGKTSSPRCGAWRPWAHPRVCGENKASGGVGHVAVGSSPRVRGKRRRRRSRPSAGRLIPACAGKTPRPGRSCTPRRAHPRVCGENLQRGGRVLELAGSSPRVRGKPVDAALGVREDRLIPACAGKTRPSAAPDPRRPAHPRVCGENVKAVRCIPTLLGSSPRVRGKPCLPVRRRGGPGLIPACAGKTP